LGNKSEEEQQAKQAEMISRIRYPNREELEMFAVATQLMGTDQVKTIAEDGIERQARIPGKMRKKVWIRQGDLLIIRLWSFQTRKADIVWRFLGTQTGHIKRKGLLKNLPI
jgi:translation initiation factor 1A